MADIATDALKRVEKLLAKYDAHPTLRSGSWEVKDCESWYEECWEFCDFLNDNPPTPSANADLRAALGEDRDKPKERRGSQENLGKVHGALLRIKAELGDHVRQLPEAKQFEFRCVDLRRVSPIELRTILDGLRQDAKATADGSMPVGFVANRDVVPIEQVRECTAIGVCFFELSENGSTAMLWISERLWRHPIARAVDEKPKKDVT